MRKPRRDRVRPRGRYAGLSRVHLEPRGGPGNRGEALSGLLSLTLAHPSPLPSRARTTHESGPSLCLAVAVRFAGAMGLLARFKRRTSETAVADALVLELAVATYDDDHPAATRRREIIEAWFAERAASLWYDRHGDVWSALILPDEARVGAARAGTGATKTAAAQDALKLYLGEHLFQNPC